MLPHPQKALQLLAGLLDQRKAYTGPFFVNIDITRRCNMRCPGCRHHLPTPGKSVDADGAPKDIPFALIQQLARELPALAVPEISLIGEGEPLLHPRLLDIIAAFKHAGTKLQLFTNGTLIDQAKASALVDSGLNAVKVTLWANSQDEYEKCHPGVNPQNFVKTLNAVELLVRQKARNRAAVSIILNQPLNRLNYRSAVERIQLARSLGCDALTFSVFRDWRGEFASLSLSAEEIAAVSEELLAAKKDAAAAALGHNIDEVLMRYRLGQFGWLRLPCYIGWLHARIKTDGTVIPCNSCDLPLGNLHRDGFAAIWNGQAYRRFRHQRSRYDGGLQFKNHCDCGWCCFVKQNAKVHRVFKWIRPQLGCPGGRGEP